MINLGGKSSLPPHTNQRRNNLKLLIKIFISLAIGFLRS